MFDNFVNDQTVLAKKRRRQRARMLGFAGALYAIGLSATIAYSYTQVESLPAPAVPVILMAAPPPPPPPPPPPAASHHAHTVIHHVQPHVLLQPLDKPIPQQNQSKDNEDQGVEGGQVGGQVGGVIGGVLGGQVGGVIGGVVGGTLGGAGDGPLDDSDKPVVQKVANVTPDTADAHRLCCDPTLISRPPAAVGAHIFGTTMVTVCVDAYGNIGNVRALTSLPYITQKVVSTIESTWKYKPFTVNGAPTPACFVVSFQYQEEH